MIREGEISSVELISQHLARIEEIDRPLNAAVEVLRMSALREAVAAILRDDRDLIWLSTGPGLLTRSLARWFTAEPGGIDERIATVAVLTLAEIRRGAAIHCYAAYKNTSRGWLNAAFAKRRRR